MLLGVATLLGVSLLAFAIMHVVPGDRCDEHARGQATAPEAGHPGAEDEDAKSQVGMLRVARLR